MADTYAIVRQFERDICDYTGARYAVTVTSCTMAIMLAVRWALHEKPSGREAARDRGAISLAVEIPKRTYVSVPMSILHAGGKPTFRDEDWQGTYELKPLNVWDSARRFTSGMYRPGTLECVSFHWGKILGIQQGGAILHDDPEADAWLRRARFDGRTEGVHPTKDTFTFAGWHAYMSPETAAQGVMRLALLKKDNPDLPNDDYPDCSAMAIFR